MIHKAPFGELIYMWLSEPWSMHGKISGLVVRRKTFSFDCFYMDIEMRHEPLWTAQPLGRLDHLELNVDGGQSRKFQLTVVRRRTFSSRLLL